MNDSNIIKQHPVASFLVITFIFTWALIAIIIFSTPAGVSPTDMPAYLFALALLGGFGPSLTGILVTRLAGGKESLRGLFARLGQWRVNAGWYAAALLICPLLSAAGLGVQAALGIPTDLGDVAGRLAIGLIWPIFSSMGEELGWRGFFLPKLQERHSALAASVIIGVTWGMWHLPMDYIGMRQYGLLFIPNFILAGPVLMTAQALLMTWVFNNTRGSLLLAVLFHASITASAIILSVSSLTATESLIGMAVSAALYWITASIVLAATGAKRLAREAQ